MQAPQDRRRFNAPSGSQPLVYAAAASSSSSSSSFSKDPSNSKREDGRTAREVRPIFMQTGLVTEASGSVYVETGRTKLICAVYGPKPSPPSAPFNAKARLNVEVKFAPFASGTRRFVPGKDTEAPALSLTLYQSLLPSLILDSLPKSQIDLFVTILESDGSDSDISAGVTAASVALAEAGIAIYGLVTGCYAAFLPIPSSSTPLALLDPTSAEARQCSAFVSVACIPALGTLTNIGMRGIASPEVFEAGVQQCFDICGQIHAVSKAALLESIGSSS